MAAVQILATGSTVTSSIDVLIADTIPISLKGLIDAKAEVLIELRDDAGGYNKVGELTSGQPSTLIVGPGTYRFTRRAGTCGVFSG